MSDREIAKAAREYVKTLEANRGMPYTVQKAVADGKWANLKAAVDAEGQEGDDGTKV